jgi:hypothetical protein
MREAFHRRVVVVLSVCGLAVWVAASAVQAPEPPRLAPAVTAVPYESPYPAPQVDPSAPPQEPAPTF